MTDLNLQIPKVFLYSYINSLSSDAFCVLVRFYKFYLENYDKEISFSYEDFQKEFLTNVPLKDENIIWTELSCQELIIRYFKENIYELNMTKIREDNIILLESQEKVQRERFRIKVTDKPFDTKKSAISDYVAKFVSKYPEELQKKIIRLIEIFIENVIRAKKYTGIQDVSELISILTNENEKDIEYVCNVFNDVKIHKKAFCPYIRGIFKNVKQRKGYRKISESLKTYESKLDESDKKFGIEIATGSVIKEQNASYQAYLKLKDFDGLKRLHSIGSVVLIEQQRENEIYSKYEWL